MTGLGTAGSGTGRAAQSLMEWEGSLAIGSLLPCEEHRRWFPPVRPMGSCYHAVCAICCLGWLRTPEDHDGGAHLDIEDVGWHANQLQ